jgi:hypothetical protein
VRPLDEPIPPTETLYRWIAVDDVNGTELLPHAIDLARSSVNRAKYWPNPLSQIPFEPALNGLAAITSAEFPTGISVNEVDYEFFAVDWPEEDNDAHAEIRSGRHPSADRPTGDRPDGFKPKSPVAKEKLRSALALKMRVVKAPT